MSYGIDNNTAGLLAKSACWGLFQELTWLMLVLLLIVAFNVPTPYHVFTPLKRSGRRSGCGVIHANMEYHRRQTIGADWFFT
jgi:hypothetical protein